MHRNLLLQVSFLSWDVDEESVLSNPTSATHDSPLDPVLIKNTDPVSKTSEWLLQMDVKKSLPVTESHESSSCVQDSDNRHDPVIRNQPTSTHRSYITTR